MEEKQGEVAWFASWIRKLPGRKGKTEGKRNSPAPMPFHSWSHRHPWGWFSVAHQATDVLLRHSSPNASRKVWGQLYLFNNARHTGNAPRTLWNLWVQRHQIHCTYFPILVWEPQPVKWIPRGDWKVVCFCVIPSLTFKLSLPIMVARIMG